MVKIVTKRRLFKLTLHRSIVDREFWNKEYCNEYTTRKYESEWSIRHLEKVIEHLTKIVKDARDKNFDYNLILGTEKEKLEKGILIDEVDFINSQDIKEWEEGMEAIESIKKINKNLEKAFAKEQEEQEEKYGTLKDIEKTIAKEKGENYE